MRLKVGQTFADHYKVVGELGRGGMGIVYRAVQLAGREVALKLVRPDLDCDQGMIDRFMREIQIAQQVKHPSVVEIYEFGVIDGVPWYAMEVLAGQSLRDRLNSAPLNLHAAIALTIELCAGLAEAHRQGVVHRDIKPENVFLADQAGKTQAKILDFGLAKQLDSNLRQLTKVGAVAGGTPGYMPREQYFAEPPIDHRADIYALGVMLFEMLSGELPYNTNNVAELITCVIERKRIRDVRTLDSSIPKPLASIIARCLAHDRGERPDDCAQLAYELNQVRRVVSPEIRIPPLALGISVTANLLAAFTMWWALQGREPTAVHGIAEAAAPAHTDALAAIETRVAELDQRLLKASRSVEELSRGAPAPADGAKLRETLDALGSSTPKWNFASLTPGKSGHQACFDKQAVCVGALPEAVTGGGTAMLTCETSLKKNEQAAGCTIEVGPVTIIDARGQTQSALCPTNSTFATVVCLGRK